jgi:hypothetical protein
MTKVGQISQEEIYEAVMAEREDCLANKRRRII